MSALDKERAQSAWWWRIGRPVKTFGDPWIRI